MKRIFLIILIFCFFATPSVAKVLVKKEVTEGNLLYNEGKFEEALKRYKQAFLGLPDSDVVNFNLGAALYKTEDYKAAINHFEKSLVSDNRPLEQRANYNLGNAEYKYGISKEDENLEEAINLLEQALRHYEYAIGLDPEDEDAKYNYEFVKRELERLKKKLKQKEQKPEEQKKKQPQTEEGKEQQKPQKQEETPQQGKEPEERKEEPKPEKGKEERPEISKPQEKEKTEQRQVPKQIPEPPKPRQEMSEEEASMLLENYRHEEEPKNLYKETAPTRGLPEALKDW